MYVFSLRTAAFRHIAITISLITAIFLAASCRAKVADHDNASAETQPVAVRASAAATDTAEPAIAAAADGTFFVAYVTHEPDKSSDLFLTKFDRELKRAGESVRIDPNAGEVKS